MAHRHHLPQEPTMPISPFRSRCAFGFAVMSVLSGGATFADATHVMPGDPRIRYVGRVDLRDNAGPRMEWSNSSLVLRIKVTGATVSLSSANRYSYAVMVDGKVTQTHPPGDAKQDVELATNLPAGE